MTEPAHPLPPLDPTNNLIFCVRCSVHYAMTHQPLCPVCVDRRKKEEQW